MHFLISVLAVGDNKDEAKNAAYSTMNDLVDWGEFDYFAESAEDSRWDECWKPVMLNSAQGQKIVASCLEQQFTDFMQAMAKIHEMISKYSDEQIFNEDFDRTTDEHLSRYQFGAASHHAVCNYLYGYDGDQIVNQAELERYDSTRTLWVVQVDCHN